MTDPNKTTPTIGVLVAWLGDEYTNTVVSGIADVAVARGANVACFVGGRIASPEPFEAQGNVVYDLVSGHNVEGLVIVAGTLVMYAGSARLERFCARYHPLPMVTIAVDVPGIPAVRVYPDHGMREAMAHLVDVHGIRRIGFIRGPENHAEAERRYALYREGLVRHGLDFDPRWVAPGTFMPAAGEAAIALLVDQAHVGLDAIMAANDFMAIAAIDALNARGIRVPHDMVVIGFDDIEEASFVTPPLTTVGQCLYEQGCEAAERLVALLGSPRVSDGSPTAWTNGAELGAPLQSRLVVRQSCGCLPSLRRRVEGSERPPISPANRRACTTLEIGALILSSANGGSERAERLYAALVDDLAGERPHSFLRTLDELMREGTTEPAAWHDVLSTLRDRVQPTLRQDSAGWAFAEDLWQLARIQVAGMAERVQARERLAAERRVGLLSDFSSALNQTINVRELARVVGQWLPLLPVKGCYLSLYEDESREWSRMILTYDRTGHVDVHEPGTRFATELLVPGKMLRAIPPFTVMVAPLCFRDHQLGLVLFETTVDETAFLRQLQEQLSSAIERIRRFEDLARLHAVEAERALELQRAYVALKDNQEKLLFSEKMASLGRLTAAIAHEMQTPLASVRNSLAELQKLVNEYQASLGDPEVTPADHAEVACDMRASLDMASGAAERAAGFVRGIKFHTRDPGDNEFARFEVAQTLEDTLLLLGETARRVGSSIALECDMAGVELYGPPGRLAQVFTNLATNAIDAVARKGGGDIRVNARATADDVIIEVEDDGCGIAPENLPRIFDPMFTTKPFGEGTGLGLSIVHDVVVRAFGGAVNVDSSVGVGTKVVVTVPRPATSATPSDDAK